MPGNRAQIYKNSRLIWQATKNKSGSYTVRSLYMMQGLTGQLAEEGLNIFLFERYGEPDPDLERECDIKVSLQMASVQYVHTQRFQAEVVAFIQHFTQLQDVLGRQRAAMEGQAVSTAACSGNEASEKRFNKKRRNQHWQKKKAEHQNVCFLLNFKLN